MIRRRWFERQFMLRLPADEFPEILERLRGTPARLEERARGIAVARLTGRSGGAWSIQEHVGHLLDLEPLWRQRAEDLLRGAPEMQAADLQNRRTHEAGHDTRAIEGLLWEFRQARGGLVERLEPLDERALAAEALHPRLREPMNLAGLAWFVAEHDDHHLATITGLLRAG